MSNWAAEKIASLQEQLHEKNQLLQRLDELQALHDELQRAWQKQCERIAELEAAIAALEKVLGKV